MKNSIRIKLTLMLTILMIFVIGTCLLLNATLLSGYYLYKQKKILIDAYTKIDSEYMKHELFKEDKEDMELVFERLASNRNIDICIWDLQIRYAFSTVSDSRFADMLLVLQNYTFPMNGTIKSEVLEADEANYVIIKSFNAKMNSYYIDLFGTLNNGYHIILRLDFESIQDSAQIYNEFLLYIGLFALLTGMIAMFFISKSFTKPILELSNIAGKMSNLDFDVKYTIKTQDEIGTLGSSINMLSDQLKQTILELKNANNELLNDIEEKTQIDEIRKEFLSNVSHELKTPIALIQGYAEGLKDNISEDEDSKEFYCEVIIDEANKMNQMVKKLLTLNQIEFGQNVVNIERFDIVTVIKSVLSSTEILFQQKEVTVIFTRNEPIYVWADEYMIEEVITNYISNALNHISGKKIIEIKLTDMKDMVRVSVFNTGDNIPDEDIEKVWIKFYKVDKARTREYGGSGIGLSIVKAIMNSHNKECGVVNHECGVEFWFDLDVTIHT